MKNQIKESFTSITSELGESTMIQFYPSLRCAGLDLKTSSILSYIIGWNISGKPCYISKEKLAKTYQLTQSEVELSIAELLHKRLIKIEEIEFKNTKARAFMVDMDNLKDAIYDSPEFQRISKIKKLNEELKLIQDGIDLENRKKNAKKV